MGYSLPINREEVLNNKVVKPRCGLSGQAQQWQIPWRVVIASQPGAGEAIHTPYIIEDKARIALG